MMWLDVFNEMRKKSGMNLDEISVKSGVPKGTLSKITAGITKAPPLETMRKLVYSMGYTLDDLDRGLEVSDNFSKDEKDHIKKYRLLDPYGKEAVDGVLNVESRRCEAEKQAAERQARAAAVQEQKRQMEAGEEIVPEGSRVIDLPFDELKASAGAGYELDYDRLVRWKVLYNEMTRKADFCLEVDGRSMEPIIHNGDIILVRQQPSVDIGEIGLFTVGDKGFVKKQGEHELISVNDEFENIVPSEYDTFFCRGKVVGVLDPDWIVEK